MSETDFVPDLEYLEDLIGTEYEISYSADPLYQLIAKEEREEFYVKLKSLLEFIEK